MLEEWALDALHIIVIAWFPIFAVATLIMLWTDDPYYDAEKREEFNDDN